MEAIVVPRHGGAEIEVPKAEANNIVVMNHFAGVNFHDTYVRSGLYPAPGPMGFVSGLEGAGTVHEVGSNVREKFQKGDRVAYTVAGSGSYAQYTSIPAAKAIPIPESVPLDTAASNIVAGLTTHFLVTSTFRVDSSSSVLIHAAAGSMGLALCSAARKLGAKLVIGTASTEAKAELARAAGAHHVILYTETPDFVPQVLELSGGRGVDAVYDGVGKSTFHGSLQCLARRGTLVLFGYASGQPDPFSPALLAQGSKFLTRPVLWDYIAEEGELSARSKHVWEWVQEGVLGSFLPTVFPLHQAADAHAALESRSSTGKMILKIPQDPLLEDPTPASQDSTTVTARHAKTPSSQDPVTDSVTASRAPVASARRLCLGSSLLGSECGTRPK